MNVILSIPPWSFEEVYPYSMSRPGGLMGTRWGTVTGVTEPLGILFIAALLRDRGHHVSVVDGFRVEPDEWIRTVEALNPAVIGFSLTSHGAEKLRVVIGDLRRRMPTIKIVVGGPHVTSVSRTILEQIPEIDFAVAGEGEVAMAELCDALETHKPVSGISGLVYRDGEKIVSNPRSPVNLRELPSPARELADMSKYQPSVGFYNRLPSISMVTSSGCPCLCKFCIASNTVNLRSMESVVNEIKENIARLGVKHVLFWDEDIALGKARLIEMCETFIREKLDITWCANLTIQKVTPDLLRLMKRAGCWRLLFGLETGIESHLRAMGKSHNIARVSEQLRMVRKAGIETFATFLLGYPNQTHADAMTTIEFAKGLPIDYAVFLNFCPFPGTPYHNDLAKYGTFEGVWSTQAVSFVPHSMTKEELVDVRVRAYRSFYLRPSYFARAITRLRSIEDVRRNARGFLSTLRTTPVEQIA